MNTAERLESYTVFSRDVIDAVAETAERQNSQTYNQLAQQFNIDLGPMLFHPGGARSPIEVLHFEPNRASDFDRLKARVYLPSYGSPLDKTRTMHHIRLFGADNNTPYIVVGTPSAIGNPTAQLSPWEMKAVRGGDMEPIARPIISYLHWIGVEQVSLMGYSGGADKEPGIARVFHEHDIAVNGMVLVESVGWKEQSVLSLARRLTQSGSEQKKYVSSTESKPYLELWEDDSMRGFAQWAGGLLRPSNVAYALHIAKGKVAADIDAALSTNEKLQAAIINGTESEMSDIAVRRTKIGKLVGKFGARITSIEVPGMHHAAVDDIDLHAALMLQGPRSFI